MSLTTVIKVTPPALLTAGVVTLSDFSLFEVGLRVTVLALTGIYYYYKIRKIRKDGNNG